MEVKVDPMLILQCSLYDDDSSDTLTDSDSIISQKAHIKYIDKLYNCNMCRKIFNRDIDLQNHMSNHLTENRILKSNHKNIKIDDDVEDDVKSIKNIEDRQTSTTPTSIEGESSENTNLLIYKCPICSKVISTKGNLKVHLETHRPKGKYACDICGRMLVLH